MAQTRGPTVQPHQPDQEKRRGEAMTAREYVEQYPDAYDYGVWTDLVQYEQTHPQTDEGEQQ